MGNFAGNDFLRDALLQLLRRHYEKGYRLDSPIEMKKVRGDLLRGILCSASGEAHEGAYL